jgi:hypothetical protein
MIKKIISVLKDEESVRMNKSTLIGFLGELYVKNILIDEGFYVEHKGNQSNVDLIIESEKIKIEVKTSTIKDFDKPFPNWNWALLSKDKTNATHNICVALNEDFTLNSIYLIKSENLKLFPEPDDKRFVKLKHVLSVRKNENTLTDLKQYTECDKLFIEKKVLKIQNDDLIKNYF